MGSCSIMALQQVTHATTDMLVYLTLTACR